MAPLNLDQRIDSKLQPVENKLKEMNLVLLGLVLALLIGFAGTFMAAAAMLIDAYNGKQATYEKVVEKIDALDRKVRDFNTGSVR